MYSHIEINIKKHIIYLNVCVIFKTCFYCTSYNMKTILLLLESENILPNVKYLIYVTHIQTFQISY